MQLEDNGQVAKVASSLLAAVHCWRYRAKSILDTWGTSMVRVLLSPLLGHVYF